MQWLIAGVGSQASRGDVQILAVREDESRERMSWFNHRAKSVPERVESTNDAGDTQLRAIWDEFCSLVEKRLVEVRGR
jgi:hypothetical protein